MDIKTERTFDLAINLWIVKFRLKLKKVTRETKPRSNKKLR